MTGTQQGTQQARKHIQSRQAHAGFLSDLSLLAGVIQPHSVTHSVPHIPHAVVICLLHGLAHHLELASSPLMHLHQVFLQCHCMPRSDGGQAHVRRSFCGQVHVTNAKDIHVLSQGGVHLLCPSLRQVNSTPVSQILQEVRQRPHSSHL